jgi:hypothetical protein
VNLSDFDSNTREILAKKFIEEVILPQWKQLSSWNNVTNQSAQVDFGYLSQHLVSIVSGISGNKRRGKGEDLADGSEVKAASCVDAEDTPRWNNVNCGAKTVESIQSKLHSFPYLFFVLLDTTERGGKILRCRIWAVRPSEDPDFMHVMCEWAKKAESGEIKSTNLQLHPPRWEKADLNITTNECGNLRLPLIYESVLLDIEGILVMQTKIFDDNIMLTGISEVVNR